MYDLLGTWEQTQTENVNGMVVTATIILKLMENGNFIASAETTPNNGRKQPEQKGKWTLYANTVSLSGVRTLVYNEKTQLLIDEINKVELKRK